MGKKLSSYSDASAVKNVFELIEKIHPFVSGKRPSRRVKKNSRILGRFSLEGVVVAVVAGDADAFA